MKKTGMIFAFRFGEAWFGKGRFREVQRLFRSHGGLRCARSVRYGLIKGKSPIGRFLNAVFLKKFNGGVSRRRGQIAFLGIFLLSVCDSLAGGKENPEQPAKRLRLFQREPFSF